MCCPQKSCKCHRSSIKQYAIPVHVWRQCWSDPVCSWQSKSHWMPAPLYPPLCCSWSGASESLFRGAVCLLSRWQCLGLRRGSIWVLCSPKMPALVPCEASFWVSESGAGTRPICHHGVKFKHSVFYERVLGPAVWHSEQNKPHVPSSGCQNTGFACKQNDMVAANTLFGCRP